MQLLNYLDILSLEDHVVTLVNGKYVYKVTDEDGKTVLNITGPKDMIISLFYDSISMCNAEYAKKRIEKESSDVS